MTCTNYDVSHFWEPDVIGITDNENKTEDQQVSEFFEKTVTRDEEGRYSVKWSWQTQIPYLSDNFGLCLGRLKSLIRRMRENIDLLKECDKTFKDQFEREIIEVAGKIDGMMVHYLLHQAILTRKKRTTKLRVVFDASAKSTVGISLNEALCRGPLILPQLSIIISIDIEKAFLQIALNLGDQDVTRFLWVKDIAKLQKQDNLIVYRFARILFGAVSSPFLLATVIQHHLKRDKSWLANAV